jgi:hypothetical protein
VAIQFSEALRPSVAAVVAVATRSQMQQAARVVVLVVVVAQLTVAVVVQQAAPLPMVRVMLEERGGHLRVIITQAAVAAALRQMVPMRRQTCLESVVMGRTQRSAVRTHTTQGAVAVVHTCWQLVVVVAAAVLARYMKFPPL